MTLLRYELFAFVKCIENIREIGNILITQY